MSEQKVRGGIDAGASHESVQQDIDPELVDDRDAQETDETVVELPDYDPDEFEFPDDEYVPEGDD